MKNRSHVVTALLLFFALVAVHEFPIAAVAAAPADDTALAKQFIESAKQSTNVPALAVILCNEAHGLTKLHEPVVALDAMRLLAEVSPADRKTAYDNMARLLTVISRVGDAAARESAVDELVAMYTAQGDAALQSSEWREASAGYRKALYLASQHRHASIDSLKNKIKAVAERERTMRRVEQLEETLLRDANNQDALEELVFMYLLDMQKPEKAAAHVSRVKNGILKGHLQLATQDTASLDAVASLKLGQWYVELSKKETGQRAGVASLNGSWALERFLLLHTAKGLDRTKAELLLNDAKAVLAKFKIDPVRVLPVVSAKLPRFRFQPPVDLKHSISLSFNEASQAKVVDAIDPKRQWDIRGATAVAGAKGQAFAFGGDGDMINLPKQLVPNMVGKRVMVAAWVKPDKDSGVIFAYGANTTGYALYLKDRKPTWSARIKYARSEVIADQAVGAGWSFIVAELEKDGTITFYINGTKSGSGKIKSLLRGRPRDGLSIGTDSGNFKIGDYPGDAEHFKGIIDEFQMWISE